MLAGLIVQLISNLVQMFLQISKHGSLECLISRVALDAKLPSTLARNYDGLDEVSLLRFQTLADTGLLIHVPFHVVSRLRLEF